MKHQCGYLFCSDFMRAGEYACKNCDLASKPRPLGTTSSIFGVLILCLVCFVFGMMYGSNSGFNKGYDAGHEMGVWSGQDEMLDLYYSGSLTEWEDTK